MKWEHAESTWLALASYGAEVLLYQITPILWVGQQSYMHSFFLPQESFQTKIISRSHCSRFWQQQEPPGSGICIPDLGTSILISMPNQGDSTLSKPRQPCGRLRHCYPHASASDLKPRRLQWLQQSWMDIDSWDSCFCTQKKYSQLA